MLGLGNMPAVAGTGPNCRQESLAAKAVTPLRVHVPERAQQKCDWRLRGILRHASLLFIYVPFFFISTACFFSCTGLDDLLCDQKKEVGWGGG